MRYWVVCASLLDLPMLLWFGFVVWLIFVLLLFHCFRSCTYYYFRSWSYFLPILILLWGNSAWRGGARYSVLMEKYFFHLAHSDHLYIFIRPGVDCVHGETNIWNCAIVTISQRSATRELRNDGLWNETLWRYFPPYLQYQVYSTQRLIQK